MYAGFQSPDDMNADWNTALFSVLKMEVESLRQEGFRVVLLGDFNGHVGDTPGVGIVGNKPDINRNGRRFSWQTLNVSILMVARTSLLDCGHVKEVYHPLS